MREKPGPSQLTTCNTPYPLPCSQLPSAAWYLDLAMTPVRSRRAVAAQGACPQAETSACRTTWLRFKPATRVATAPPQDT